MRKNLPSLSLPRPYLCSDPGSFAENTLKVRLPQIARRVIAENHFSEFTNQKIEALILELTDGVIREIGGAEVPDFNLWKEYLRPYIGLPWKQLPFLVCENAFYRRILEATGYFQKGPTYHIDPYSYQKRLGFETSRPDINALAARLETWLNPDFSLIEALTEAIESTLWSNRADLSLWPADSVEMPVNAQLQQPADFLLVNDLPEMVKTILRFREGDRRVDFLIDNAGYELVCDLAFADFLLSRGLVKQVHFHLKAHPTFVSDALAADVRWAVIFLLKEADVKTAGFGERVAQTIEDKRLYLDQDTFWNSPLAGWEMPDAIRIELAFASLVISKGDANYRRLVGDLHWDETTSFKDIVEYFPTRLAALRTMKSEVIAGLREGLVNELDRREPTWRTNGRWGVVQLGGKYRKIE